MRNEPRAALGYAAIGGILWACGVTVLGYYLGTIPFIRHNLEAALILIVFVSVIPMLVEYLLHRRRAKQVLADAAGSPTAGPSEQ